jgi:hypothetical protein
MKEQKRKEKKQIVVLDKGIDIDTFFPPGFCCTSPMFRPIMLPPKRR